jgi:hypothetical protein
MLYFGNSSRDTRWVPFPLAEVREINGEQGKLLSELQPSDDQEVEYYEAEGLMAGLVDRKEKTAGWARDKFVLFIGKFLSKCENVSGLNPLL